MMRLLRITAAVLLLSACFSATLVAGEKWQGIDETVVGKIAREHGREVKKSLIDTSEGDLQLFAFLTAGVVGGFAAGYYWRVLLEGKKKAGREE